MLIHALHAQLRTQLIQALDHSTLPDEDLLTYVARFQHDIVELLDDTLVESTPVASSGEGEI